jgi:hypothetical protein
VVAELVQMHLLEILVHQIQAVVAVEITTVPMAAGPAALV